MSEPSADFSLRDGKRIAQVVRNAERRKNARGKSGKSNPTSAGKRIAVTLNQVGGSQGSATTGASWTYQVVNLLTGAEIYASADPTASPHRCTRPALGRIIAATAGEGSWVYNDSSEEFDFVLLDTNEQPDTKKCPGSTVAKLGTITGTQLNDDGDHFEITSAGSYSAPTNREIIYVDNQSGSSVTVEGVSVADGATAKLIDAGGWREW